ncbi:MFS transporter [Nocardia sp. NPDC052112]|uniref:MFS transporter n=1 Tax=Nocardia sp. NPDC052112 TaxID=3155646 RepID=UPI00343CFE70
MTARLESLRGLPRSVWVLLAVTALTVTADFMVIPYYSVHFTHTLHLGVTFGAAVMTAFVLTSRGAQFVGGFLTDRFQPERIITAGFFGMVAGFLILSVAGSAAPVTVAMLLLGLGDGCLVIAMRYKLIANTDPGLRPRLFALTSVCFNAGTVAGPLIGALLLGLSYRLAFATVAAVFIATYAAQRLLTARSAPGTAHPNDLRTDLRGLVRHRELRQAVTLITGFWVLFSQFQFSMPVVVATLYPAGWQAVIGTLYTLNGVLIVLFNLPITRALEKRPPRRVMVAGFVVVQLSFLALAVVQQSRFPLFLTYAAVAAFTLGEIIFNTFANTHMAAIAPDGRLATYIGILGLATGVGAAIGNVLSGFLIEPLLATQRVHLVWAIFVVVSVPFLAVAAGWCRPLFRPSGETPHRNEQALSQSATEK